jgi:lysozyme family protein
MNLNEAIEELIQIEGGYVNLPHDRGGPTKFGITLKTLTSFMGTEQTAADVAAITKSTAKQIYARNYFTRPCIHELPETILRQMLGMSVHHGPKRAIKLLQKTVGTSPDGRIGPITIAACYEQDAVILNNNLVVIRVEYMARIVKRDVSQAEFILGWVRRAMRYLHPL